MSSGPKVLVGWMESSRVDLRWDFKKEPAYEKKMPINDSIWLIAHVISDARERQAIIIQRNILDH